MHDHHNMASRHGDLLLHHGTRETPPPPSLTHTCLHTYSFQLNASYC